MERAKEKIYGQAVADESRSALTQGHINLLFLLRALRILAGGSYCMHIKSPNVSDSSRLFIPHGDGGCSKEHAHLDIPNLWSLSYVFLAIVFAPATFINPLFLIKMSHPR